MWPTVSSSEAEQGELGLHERTAALLQSCPVALTPAEKQIDKLLVSVFLLFALSVPSVHFLTKNRKQTVLVAGDSVSQF